jgi:succinate-semialdehyde dehydrogenase / glutarate-semialdehyde dehydrogenase
VQEGVYERFVSDYVRRLKAVTVGDGLDEATEMGPLANVRRVQAM